MGDYDYSDTPRDIVWNIVQSLKAFTLAGCSEKERPKFQEQFEGIEQFVKTIPGEKITEVLAQIKSHFPTESRVFDTMNRELGD